MATNTQFTTDHDALLTLVRTWDRRLRTQQMAVWIPRALAAALGVGVALAVIARVRPFILNTDLAWIAIGLAALAVIACAAVIWLWKRTPIHAARRFDVLLNLEERTSTALELLEGQIHADDDLVRRQIDDAKFHARAAKPTEAIPVSVQRRDAALVAVLAGLLIILLFLPNPAASSIEQQSAQAAAIDEAQSTLRQITEEVAADQGLEEEERGALLEILQDNREALDEATTPEQAFAALAEVAAALRDTAGRFSESMAAAEQDAAAANEALGSLPDFQGRPQQSSAMQELADMLSAMQQMMAAGPTDPGAMADALEQAADSVQNSNPQAAQAMRDAAQSLRDGDQQAAEDQLSNAQQSAQQNAQQQAQNQETAESLDEAAQDAQNAAQDLSEASQNPQQGQQSQAQQQGVPSENAQQEGQNTGGDQQSQSQAQSPQDQESQQGTDGQSEQGSSEGASQQSGQQSQQQGQNPSDQGNQASQAEGDLSGAAVRSAGGAEGDAGAESQQQITANDPNQPMDNNNQQDGQGQRGYEQVFAPQRIGGQPGENTIVLDPDTSDVPVVEGNFSENDAGEALVGYDQVFSDYANAANAALENDRVPLALRDLVRQYFTALDPNQQNNGN